MKRLVVLAMVMLDGCASQQTTDGLKRQILALSDNQTRFQQSTLYAQRNTVERINQLELRVDDLADRVCRLEKERGVSTGELDKRFRKYMSK